MSVDNDVITAEEFRGAMLAAGGKFGEKRNMLAALDAAAGDGDLGATLTAGFGHVREAIVAIPDGDVGALLKEAGVTLVRKAPSTLGALLGGAFMRAGGEFAGMAALRAVNVAHLMAALLAAVSERGGALPGQRTIVDALDGAASAAADAAAAGSTAEQTLAAAARGAAAGAEATAQMEPKFGRAAWVAERARGERDAGAVAWAIYLGALSAAVRVQRKADV